MNAAQVHGKAQQLVKDFFKVQSTTNRAEMFLLLYRTRASPDGFPQASCVVGQAACNNLIEALPYAATISRIPTRLCEKLADWSAPYRCILSVRGCANTHPRAATAPKPAFRFQQVMLRTPQPLVAHKPTEFKIPLRDRHHVFRKDIESWCGYNRPGSLSSIDGAIDLRGAADADSRQQQPDLCD